MSGLAGVLAGQRPPGVFLRSAEVAGEDVRRAVAAAGWELGHVDGSTDGTKRGFLTAVGEALRFPDHYGHNLDALADCLADLRADTVLLWDGWATLARHDPKAFRISLEVLRDRAGDSQSTRFVALLNTDGPELDLPTLGD